MTALILAVVEFGRSHSESTSKANRMGEVWAEKRKAVREQSALMTRKLPAWLEERNGKPVLIPDRAKVVRRMFDLAVRGYGLSLIVRELTLAKVPVWGRQDRLVESLHSQDHQRPRRAGRVSTDLSG